MFYRDDKEELLKELKEEVVTAWDR
jgi:hypothetical protein